MGRRSWWLTLGVRTLKILAGFERGADGGVGFGKGWAARSMMNRMAWDSSAAAARLDEVINLRWSRRIFACEEKFSH